MIGQKFIFGDDLQKYLKTTRPHLAAKIDPKGQNVIVHTSPGRDANQICPFIMIKFQNERQPRFEIVELPVDVYDDIVHVLYDQRSADIVN